MNKCNQCYKPTKNPKFCSKSCSATFNNSKNPKRTKTNLCVDCKKHTKGTPRTNIRLCRECWKARKLNEQLQKTKKELTSKKYEPKNKYHRIRQLAHRVVKFYDLKPNKCYNCNYSKTLQLCHLKPIADFDDKSLIKEINSKDNLKFLCPNCHWELDNNLLTI